MAEVLFSLIPCYIVCFIYLSSKVLNNVIELAEGVIFNKTHDLSPVIIVMGPAVY